MIAHLADGDAGVHRQAFGAKSGLKVGDTIRLATRRGPREKLVVGVVVEFMNQGMVIIASWNDLRRYLCQWCSMFMVTVEQRPADRKPTC